MELIAQFERKYSTIAGSLYGFGNAASFFVVASVVKYFQEEHQYNAGQLFYLRCFNMFLFQYAIFRNQKVDLYPKRKTLHLVSLRNFFDIVATMGIFWGIQKVPLSQVLIFEHIQPIVIPILDNLLLKTKYTLKEILMTLFAILGIFMVISPQYFGANIEINETRQYAQGIEKLIVLLILFVFVTLFISFASILVKYLKDESPGMINQQFALLGMWIGSIFSIDSAQVKFHYMDFILISLSVGLIGVISQNCYVRAFQLGKPGTVSLICSASIIFALLYEIFILDEKIHFIQIIGAFLLIFSIGIILKIQK